MQLIIIRHAQSSNNVLQYVLVESLVHNNK